MRRAVLGRDDEELRAVGVGPGVGHRQQARLVVLQREVLVDELAAVDRLAARAVVRREVAALDHEVLDHTVERAAAVEQRHARLAHAALARTQRAEVLHRARALVAEKLEHHAAKQLAVDANVEERARVVLF